MATTFSNLAPSQTVSNEARKPQNSMPQVSDTIKNVSKPTQNKVVNAGISILAKIIFKQSNFNFLDIPTANSNKTQQEMI